MAFKYKPYLGVKSEDLYEERVLHEFHPFRLLGDVLLPRQVEGGALAGAQTSHRHPRIHLGIGKSEK